MNKNIKEYIEEIPEKLDSKKNISLFKLIKTSCPWTIRQLNRRLHGKRFFYRNDKKWYTSIVNYLVKKSILETERSDLGTYHNVAEEYKKYFIIPKSTIFSLSNVNSHLMLYKQTAQDFLNAAGLLDKEGKEYLAPDKKEIKKDLSSSTKRTLRIVSLIMVGWAILQFILLISRYGILNMIPMLLTSILFSIGLLVYIK